MDSSMCWRCCIFALALGCGGGTTEAGTDASSEAGSGTGTSDPTSTTLGTTIGTTESSDATTTGSTESSESTTPADTSTSSGSTSGSDGESSTDTSTQSSGDSGDSSSSTGESSTTGGAASGVIAISAAYSHTCALLDNGAVRCWGGAGDGKLGYGNGVSYGDDEDPAVAGDVDVGGTVVQLATGSGQTCALLDTQAVRCWGNGQSGRLGYGNELDIGDDDVPASAGDVDLGAAALQVTASGVFTCAVIEPGDVLCWGATHTGATGVPGAAIAIGDDETPADFETTMIGADVVAMDSSQQHSCALTDTGTLRCWGHAVAGKLGYGNTTTIGDDETPASAGDVDVGGTVVQIATGGSHTCALIEGGAVRCWGSGLVGQLGHGNDDAIGNDELPSVAGDVDIGGVATSVVVGDRHTCALLVDATIRCWGLGALGQTGQGTTDNIGDDELPSSVDVVDVGGDVQSIASGYEHTCAVLVGGTVRCWGRNDSGQLGYGHTDVIGDDETPASAGDVVVL